MQTQKIRTPQKPQNICHAISMELPQPQILAILSLKLLLREHTLPGASTSSVTHILNC